MWFYANGANKFGPLTAQQLRAAAVEGKIHESTLIWRDGLKEWVPATKIQGLVTAPPPLPPAPVAQAIPVARAVPVAKPMPVAQAMPAYQAMPVAQYAPAAPFVPAKKTGLSVLEWIGVLMLVGLAVAIVLPMVDKPYTYIPPSKRQRVQQPSRQSEGDTYDDGSLSALNRTPYGKSQAPCEACNGTGWRYDSNGKAECRCRTCNGTGRRFW